MRHQFSVELPLIVLVYGDVDDAAEVDEVIAAMTAQVQTNREPYALLVAPSMTRNPPLAMLHRQGQWMKQHRELLAAHCVGTAFVFASPVYRLMLSTVFLVQPMPMPFVITSSVDAAETWMNERLKRAGAQPIRVARDRAPLAVA